MESERQSPQCADGATCPLGDKPTIWKILRVAVSRLLHFLVKYPEEVFASFQFLLALEKDPVRAKQLLIGRALRKDEFTYLQMLRFLNQDRNAGWTDDDLGDIAEAYALSPHLSIEDACVVIDILMDAKQPASALAVYRRFLPKLSAPQAKEWLDRGVYLNAVTGRVQDALAACETSIRENGPSAWRCCMQANQLYRLQRWAEARDAYAACERMEPGYLESKGLSECAEYAAHCAGFNGSVTK